MVDSNPGNGTLWTSLVVHIYFSYEDYLKKSIDNDNDESIGYNRLKMRFFTSKSNEKYKNISRYI